ncbi:MAG: ATP-binding protein [Clostridiales bacterium]|jgi:hypothetical protein|nr:ATP-binding protein [Clostridiales bacterium]
MNELIPDIPRIHTAVAEWAACMVYVLILKKRFKGAALWAASAGALGFFCGLQVLAGIAPLWLWIPCMAAAAGAMYLTIFAFTRCKASGALFWTARAFILAEFAASLEWQLYYYCARLLPNADKTALQILFLAAVGAAACAAACFLERRYASANDRLTVTRGGGFTAAALAAAVFALGNMSFITSNSPVSGSSATDIFWIRTLVDFCGLAMLFVQQEQRLWLYAKDEMHSMRNMLTRQYEQYAASKDNIDFLNRRYHDLKHQIGVLRSEGDPEKKAAYFDELERGIKVYEAQTHTGNGVLDVVLTGKTRICAENGINFTCVANGSLLDFMDVMDICSVVGNALDNAIESVVQLPDVDKRLVKMAVYLQNGLLVLRFENYVEHKPEFENGLPVTTKRDKRNHGYGIKSIRSIAEKYGGSIGIRVEGDWFTLCLLIPHDGHAKE